jgi:hypothetical protein
MRLAYTVLRLVASVTRLHACASRCPYRMLLHALRCATAIPSARMRIAAGMSWQGAAALHGAAVPVQLAMLCASAACNAMQATDGCSRQATVAYRAGTMRHCK